MTEQKFEETEVLLRWESTYVIILTILRQSVLLYSMLSPSFFIQSHIVIMSCFPSLHLFIEGTHPSSPWDREHWYRVYSRWETVRKSERASTTECWWESDEEHEPFVGAGLTLSCAAVHFLLVYLCLLAVQICFITKDSVKLIDCVAVPINMLFKEAVLFLLSKLCVKLIFRGQAPAVLFIFIFFLWRGSPQSKFGFCHLYSIAPNWSVFTFQPCSLVTNFVITSIWQDSLSSHSLVVAKSVSLSWLFKFEPFSYQLFLQLLH